MYIETSYPRSAGHKARLSSPSYTTSVTGCAIDFWYHMYGATTGTLNVYVKDTISGRNFTIWTKSGNQGNKWQRATVNIANVTGTFFIIFEGIVGSSFTGDIAIDDFSFSKTCCGRNPCGEARADFQTSMSGFTQSKSDNFDWTRDYGGTPSRNTGPSVDHTLGTSRGYYMYIETSGRTAGQKAQLLSPLYIEGAPSCSFSFWFHMYGHNDWNT